MGENNSTKTHVAPLGRTLLKHHDILNDLLDLIGCGDVNFGEFRDEDVFFSDSERQKKEKHLPPPRSHLEGILSAIAEDKDGALAFFKKALAAEEKEKRVSEQTTKERLRFAEGIIPKEEALKHLKGWAKLEKGSYPDLFVENENYILLVEGKLTEPSTTQRVRYIANRSQMVRHIQNTIEYLRKKGAHKKIIAFYILPYDFKNIDELKQRQAIERDMNIETVPVDDAVRKKIAAAYYGCTTWEAVSERLKISFPPIKPLKRK